MLCKIVVICYVCITVTNEEIWPCWIVSEDMTSYLREFRNVKATFRDSVRRSLYRMWEKFLSTVLILVQWRIVASRIHEEDFIELASFWCLFGYSFPSQELLYGRDSSDWCMVWGFKWILSFRKNQEMLYVRFESRTCPGIAIYLWFQTERVFIRNSVSTLF